MEKNFTVQSYKVKNYDEDIGISISETRYRIISEDGKMLDDAQGYGYKSAKKAYAGFAYKSRSASTIAKENHIKKWIKKHPEVSEEFEYALFNAVKANVPKEFNETIVEQILKEMNLQIDFTPKELLRIWKRYR